MDLLLTQFITAASQGNSPAPKAPALREDTVSNNQPEPHEGTFKKVLKATESHDKPAVEEKRSVEKESKEPDAAIISQSADTIKQTLKEANLLPESLANLEGEAFLKGLADMIQGLLANNSQDDALAAALANIQKLLNSEVDSNPLQTLFASLLSLAEIDLPIEQTSEITSIKAPVALSSILNEDDTNMGGIVLAETDTTQPVNTLLNVLPNADEATELTNITPVATATQPNTIQDTINVPTSVVDNKTTSAITTLVTQSQANVNTVATEQSLLPTTQENVNPKTLQSSINTALDQDTLTKEAVPTIDISAQGKNTKIDPLATTESQSANTKDANPLLNQNTQNSLSVAKQHTSPLQQDDFSLNNNTVIHLQQVNHQYSQFADNLNTGQINADRPTVANQITVQIDRALKSGQHNITIKLSPAELGHVDVKLHWNHEGKTNVVIAVERQETLDLLQRDARQLERALQDAGLKTDSGSLSFNLRQQNANDQQNHGFSGHTAHNNNAEHNEELKPITNITQVYRGYVQINNGVDISV